MANTLHHHILLLLLFLFACLHLAAAQRRQLNISRGSSLTPTGNSSWLSPSGLYALGFYKQGNGYAVGIFLAGIPQKTVVWTANRDDPPVSDRVTLLLTTDGRLILQQLLQEGFTNVTNIVAVSEPIFQASLQDTGNFVLYNSNMDVIWQSFEHPTNTILPNQRLLNGLDLVSSISETDNSQGNFRLVMQGDGNLVQYPLENSTPSDAYYASNTAGAGDNVTLNLDSDGHLYLINSSINILSNLTNGYSENQRIYFTKIDVDGIFRLYSYNQLERNGNFSILWESVIDKCSVKGICGPNGICTLDKDDAPKCTCLPGFDHTNDDNWNLGCKRNYTSGSCVGDDKSSVDQYIMRELPNIGWKNAPYQVVKTLFKEDCETACNEDCNCEAALFVDQQCRKQTLPLKYGKRSASDSTIAFVKVGLAKFVADGNPPDLSTKVKKELRIDIVFISASLLALSIVIFVISSIIVHKYKISRYNRLPKDVELMEGVAPRAFTYAELEEMTGHFQEEIGRGMSGTVYKGTLLGSTKLVAVKRLDNVITEEDKEFHNEMKVIGKTHHRNLVSLLGYSIDGPKKLLVYEYMVNGSLAEVLFTHKLRLTWEQRICIALDIVRGILYLHEECETQIIHCDIKPQNILMDMNTSAKISDFGLAKLLRPDQTNTYTGVRGTRGYVAPEFYRKMPITVKADVYSFGIVLLEILCCRRSLDNSLPDEECVLEEWVYQCFENRELEKLAGDEEIDKKKLDRMVRVSLWCILDDPSLRPSMKKVLLMLEGTVDIPVPPSPSSYLSAV